MPQESATLAKEHFLRQDSYLEEDLTLWSL
jgi:hypothetical protein